MLRKTVALALVLLAVGVATSAQAPRRIAAGDWPEMRGPGRDGTSRETGLIDKWAMNGENFLWRVPYGGRSAGTGGKADEPEGMQAISIELVHLIALDPCLQIF